MNNGHEESEVVVSALKAVVAARRREECQEQQPAESYLVRFLRAFDLETKRSGP